MKRFLLWVLVLTLALGCLAGCGGSKPSDPQPSEDTDATLPTIKDGTQDSDQPTVQTAPPEEQPVTPQVTLSSDGDIGMPPQGVVSAGDLIMPAEEVKAALVVPEHFGDRGFADAAKSGLDQLKKEYGIGAVTVECGGAEYEKQLRNAAENASIVVCVGSEFSALHDVAPDFPKVHFIWIDGGQAEPVDNVLQVAFAQNEGAYLAGYAAASSSQRGKLGVVCAGDSLVVRDYLAGFRQGAAACKDGIEVLTEDIGKNGDAAAAHDAALSLSNQGVDVIFQLAGAAGSGVFAAAQEKNFYLIGAESDQKYLADGCVLCSVVKAVDTAVHNTVLEAMRGRFDKWGGVWVLTLGSGYVSIGYGDDGATKLVSDELVARVDELLLQIASGEIKVDTAR